jgi:hypothetical protein
VDARAAAPKGGLRGRHYGERRVSGGGLSPRSFGWCGVDGGRSQIAVRRRNLGTSGG